jgi:SOUL heme-binding protein
MYNEPHKFVDLPRFGEPFCYAVTLKYYPNDNTMLRSFLFLALAAMSLHAQAIEEPSYEVTKKFDNVEIRLYAPYVVAEVVLDATAENAGNQAFPILAGYIFGKNKGEKKFAMTAPVTQMAEPARMAMTAPVTQAAVAGGMRVQFVLPKTVSLATAPEPLDSRVQLRLVPAASWAVIRYSGTWSDSNYNENLQKLKVATETAGIKTNGEPVLARYNGPMTPWFIRRNEVWLAVQ